MSYTTTATHTYSVADIEAVMRRFTADLLMITQSTGAITEAKAHEYAHDVEVLAKRGYLASVDLTLLAGGVEIRAARYSVNTASSELTTSRPGGVRWPRVANPDFRIVLWYQPSYDAAAREAMRTKLLIGWVPTLADLSHAGLARAGGRDYASNGGGLQRQDYVE